MPRGPLSFAREAIPGACRRSALHFAAAWGMLQLLPAALWALQLRQAAGSSALPSFWGELLQMTDLWQLIHHGGLEEHFFGPFLPWSFALLAGWMLWAGWKHQAESAHVRAAFGPWALGLFEGLLLAALPAGLLASLVHRVLAWAASSGIEGLGWAEFLGNFILGLGVPSLIILQGWLCRLDRAEAPAGWRMGGWGNLGRHLGRSFLRLWLNAIHWFLLVLGGILVRGGAHALALWLAWRWGGSSLTRVWGFILIEAGVALANAFLLAWFLRLVALFWRHDHRLRLEIRNLERALHPGASA